MEASLIHSAEARAREAIEETYKAFAGPVPAVIEECPCCVGARGTDVLLTNSLRQLSGDALWQYVSGAFLTVGSARDFRYLLPRILEIAVLAPGKSNDPEIILAKLGLANWQSWTDRERRVVKQVISDWFALALARDGADADSGWIGNEAEGVLCGASRACISLEPLLIRLHQLDAAPILTDMKDRYPDRLSPFWEYAPGGYAEFAAVLAQGHC